MSEKRPEAELKMDADNLYCEELFTDRRVGTIQRLTPVDGSGDRDTSRPVLYIGQTQLMTQAGPLPLSFELSGDSLADAAAGFADAANLAVEDAVKRLEEFRREAASSIIVPEGGAGPVGGAGPMGGGKIQIP